MFSLLSGFWTYLFSKPNLHVLIIGIDYAGKTTILEKIKSEFGKTPGLPADKIPPTIGMNLAKINYKGSQVVIWDLGGQLKMRSIWEKYYDEANAVVFVIDSADVGRLNEAKLAFDATCDHEILRQVPILTLANKQDLQGALSPEDLSVNFSSPSSGGASASKTHIFPISAMTGFGLPEAIEVIVEEAKRNAKKISRI